MNALLGRTPEEDLAAKTAESLRDPLRFAITVDTDGLYQVYRTSETPLAVYTRIVANGSSDGSVPALLLLGGPR